MARINLLPWRAERRKQRQREFQGMLGLAALAGVLMSFLVWFYFDRQITGQHERNSFLQAEIVKVQKQNEEIKELDSKKDRLLARKKVIEELQANRSQMVHLFDSLVRTIPDGVALASIKQEGEILTLEGRAQSNARVSAYMRNLETSGWMTDPDLSIIEAKGEEKTAAGIVSSDVRALPYVFTLQVKLANPNAPDEEGGVAPAGSPAVADSTVATSAAPAVATPAAPATTAPAAVTPAPAPASAPAPAADTKPTAAPGPAATPSEQPAPATQGRPES